MKILKILGKRNLVCLSLISCFFLTGLSCSVSNKKSDELIMLEKYFETEHNVKLGDNINKLIVLTDNGCDGCNKNFAHFALENMYNETALFLINSQGTSFDISPFMQLEKNVYFDWNLDPVKYKIFNETRVIYLDKEKIDTIITINTNELNDQLSFMSKYKNSNK